MGTSRTPGEFIGKIRAAENRLHNFDRKSVLPVADAVKQVFTASAASAGLRRGSKIANRPWRGVYVRNSGTQNLAVGYAAPAHLVNNKTRRHVIGAKKLGTRRTIASRVAAGKGLKVNDKRFGSTVLHWGGAGGPFARYVQHPGTRGKQFYEKALPPAEARARVEFQRGVNRTLAAVFK